MDAWILIFWASSSTRHITAIFHSSIISILNSILHRSNIVLRVLRLDSILNFVHVFYHLHWIIKVECSLVFFNDCCSSFTKFIAWMLDFLLGSISMIKSFQFIKLYTGYPLNILIYTLLLMNEWLYGLNYISIYADILR